MILVISPHLDDAVFSCGGLLAALPAGEATVVTCFTRSVAQPRGFALACQRDKGLSDEVDYMKLRREEDRVALDGLGTDYRWLDFPEAPHRGYESAAHLFAGIHSADVDLAEPLGREIERLVAELRPECVLYPFGAGNHADHLQVIGAVDRVARRIRKITYLQYFDQPYTARNRGDYPQLVTEGVVRPGGLANFPIGSSRLPLSPELRDRKLRACAGYVTQVPFQFGDVEGMRQLLGDSEYFWREK